MSVTSVLLGAPLSTSFRVTAVVTDSSARLAVSRTVDLANPVYFGPATASAQGVAQLTATGLDPATMYYWAVESGGVLNTTRQGSCQTAPLVGTPTSFSFAVYSCADGAFTPYPAAGAGQVSNHPVIETLSGLGLAFGGNLGDWAYPNIITNDPSLFRGLYDRILAAPRWGRLCAVLPQAYMPDDHDFGDNNSDSTIPSKPACQQVHRERFPSYPLPSSTGGMYHSFRWGRLLTVVLDCRSYRDPDTSLDTSTKTMLGAEQKAWLFALLDAAKTDPTVGALQVWSTSPWIAATDVADTWGLYSFERAEVGAKIEATFGGRCWMVVGDTHALSGDDGTNNPAGTFPSFVCSSLDSNPQDRGGPHSMGSTMGVGRYGLFKVEDFRTGMEVTFTGMVDKAVWKSLTMKFGAAKPPPGHLRDIVGLRKAGESRTLATVRIGGVTRRLRGLYTR